MRNWAAKLGRWTISRNGTDFGSEISAAEQIHPAVRFSMDGEILVVLDIAQGRLFRCNPTGSLIWRLLAANQQMEAIALEISGRYAIPAAQARQVVATYLQQLRHLQLLVPGWSQTL